MEYRFSISIDRHDDPKLSKYGNPSLRFSFTWGLVAYEGHNRVPDADIIESSDGNVLVHYNTGLAFTRARGWMGLVLNRPSPALEQKILEALHEGGYVEKLLKFSEQHRKEQSSLGDIEVSENEVKEDKWKKK